MTRTFTDVEAVRRGAGVRSRFALCALVRLRATHLDLGAPALVPLHDDIPPGNPVAIASAEVRAGLVRLRRRT